MVARKTSPFPTARMRRSKSRRRTKSAWAPLNNGSRKTEQNASSIIYNRIRRRHFGLSGSPSQSFETDDGLKLSSKIRGSFASEYVVDLVNCMGTGSLQGNVISSAWSRCALIRSCSSRSEYVRDTWVREACVFEMANGTVILTVLPRVTRARRNG